uniref:Uncharacterized protein n=1 Tax=Solanum tuberosum TaxID=4113 RepID=M1D9H6_SOLTU
MSVAAVLMVVAEECEVVGDVFVVVGGDTSYDDGVVDSDGGGGGGYRDRNGGEMDIFINDGGSPVSG